MGTLYSRTRCITTYVFATLTLVFTVIGYIILKFVPVTITGSEAYIITDYFGHEVSGFRDVLTPAYIFQENGGLCVASNIDMFLIFAMYVFAAIGLFGSEHNYSLGCIGTGVVSIVRCILGIVTLVNVVTFKNCDLSAIGGAMFFCITSILCSIACFLCMVTVGTSTRDYDDHESLLDIFFKD